MARDRSQSPQRRSYRRDDDEYDDRRREGSSSRRRDDDNPRRRRSRSRSRDRDRSRRDRSEDNNNDKAPSQRQRGPLPSQSAALAEAGVPSGSRAAKYGNKNGNGHEDSNRRSQSPSAEAIAASKPNFKNSGALAAETNTFQGVVLKYNEPPEARKPNKAWRMYVFKGGKEADSKDSEMILVNRQSAYLFGRDRVVADVPLDHPSASKQHAVLQYRSIHERNEFGDTKSVTKPYLIDLESANGTTVNDDKLPKSRYYELKSGDVIKFAYSTKEYVLIADQ